MTRTPSHRPPAYRLHKPTGRAVATVRLPDGTRKDVYLGPYDSPESRDAYARLIAELAAGRHPLAGAARGRPDVTVNEVLLAYLRHAREYYRHPDGSPTSEARNVADAVRPVKAMYGPTPAAAFGPLALKAVRQAMVDAGLCRPVVNARVNRVRRVFKWAAGEELVPFDVYHRLTAVQGLGRGRTAAREPEPVPPVDPDVVAATRPFLPPAVAAMVEVQRLTGMRPGEAVRMRAGDLDRSGPVWVYRPAGHKTAYRNRSRTVAIGPQAQAVLAPYLARSGGGYVFSPARERQERYAALRVTRKTKVPPSQADRRKAEPKKAPGERYATDSYRSTIAEGVEKANARRERLAGAGNFDPVPHWHPNQLRHAHATEVRKRYGLEAAQVVLGHAKADVTQVYAERDLTLAARVAAEIG